MHYIALEQPYTNSLMKAFIMSRTSQLNSLLFLFGILFLRAKGTILTSKYTRVPQNISKNGTAINFEKTLSVLNVYCGSHGCQIRFGNDVLLRQFSSESFNCTGNDETACGLDFTRAQQALKILLAKRDSLYLLRWLNLNYEMVSTLPDKYAQGKKIASNEIRYQKP